MYTRRQQRAWDALWLLVATAIVAYIFYRDTMLASRVIDGARWFVIDDDMMISMRYGRNLAEGHGLVWNAGEHVEGYTNFLWTIVMAAVHALGAPDRTAAVWVRACGFVFITGSFIQSIRLLRAFAPRTFWATPACLAATIMSLDVVLWAAWGFETSLLTFLFITFLASVVRDPKSVIGWAALALVPLTRGDGIHIFLSSALIGFFLANDKKDILRRIALAAIPVALHFAFRRAYYGDWLPNTYYLKVYLLDNVRGRGIAYARNFLLTYPIPIALASGAALSLARRDQRALLFFVVLGSTLFYVSNIGGDMMGSFRFCAHIVPVIFVFAAAGVANAVESLPGRAAWVAVLYIATVPLIRPLDRLIALDGNGDPQEQMQVAMLITKNALPESSIGVIAAGIVPYFTRRPAIDILGKSDRHIARLKPFKGAMVGHGKMDLEYSFLEKKPDLFVSLRNVSTIATFTPGNRTADPVLSILSSLPFQQTYRPYPIDERWSLNTTAIFTYAGSPEASRRHWQPLMVGPWP